MVQRRKRAAPLRRSPRRCTAGRRRRISGRFARLKLTATSLPIHRQLLAPSVHSLGAASRRGDGKSGSAGSAEARVLHPPLAPACHGWGGGRPSARSGEASLTRPADGAKRLTARPPCSATVSAIAMARLQVHDGTGATTPAADYYRKRPHKVHNLRIAMPQELRDSSLVLGGELALAAADL